MKTFTFLLLLTISSSILANTITLKNGSEVVISSNEVTTVSCEKAPQIVKRGCLCKSLHGENAGEFLSLAMLMNDGSTKEITISIFNNDYNECSKLLAIHPYCQK